LQDGRDGIPLRPRRQADISPKTDPSSLPDVVIQKIKGGRFLGHVVEVNGKSVGKCFLPGTHGNTRVLTHTRTEGRTTRKHNASGPIDKLCRSPPQSLLIAVSFELAVFSLTCKNSTSRTAIETGALNLQPLLFPLTCIKFISGTAINTK